MGKWLGFVQITFFILYFNCACVNISPNNKDPAISTSVEDIFRKNINVLNNIIDEIANDIGNKLTLGTKVALFDLPDNEENVLLDYITQELAVFLVNNNNLIVLERKYLASIYAEQAFQMSGEVNDNEIISVCGKYGAQSVVFCSVSFLGGLCRLQTRTLDVETARIQTISSYVVDVPQNLFQDETPQYNLVLGTYMVNNAEENIEYRNIKIIPTSRFGGSFEWSIIYKDGKGPIKEINFGGGDYFVPVTINTSSGKSVYSLDEDRIIFFSFDGETKEYSISGLRKFSNDYEVWTWVYE
jgi:hypothetical protein